MTYVEVKQNTKQHFKLSTSSCKEQQGCNCEDSSDPKPLVPGPIETIFIVKKGLQQLKTGNIWFLQSKKY